MIDSSSTSISLAISSISASSSTSSVLSTTSDSAFNVDDVATILFALASGTVKTWEGALPPSSSSLSFSPMMILPSILLRLKEDWSSLSRARNARVNSCISSTSNVILSDLLVVATVSKSPPSINVAAAVAAASSSSLRFICRTACITASSPTTLTIVLGMPPTLPLSSRNRWSLRALANAAFRKASSSSPSSSSSSLFKEDGNIAFFNSVLNALSDRALPLAIISSYLRRRSATILASSSSSLSLFSFICTLSLPPPSLFCIVSSLSSSSRWRPFFPRDTSTPTAVASKLDNRLFLEATIPASSSPSSKFSSFLLFFLLTSSSSSSSSSLLSSTILRVWRFIFCRLLALANLFSSLVRNLCTILKLRLFSFSNNTVAASVLLLSPLLSSNSNSSCV